MGFLGDVVGAKDYHAGNAPHVRGIRVTGSTISFTLTSPSQDFLDRISLPFFCVLPTETPVPEGGLADPAPSAAPYYPSDSFNGEYLILRRNPNYTGPNRAKLDAIALRLGVSSEHTVARVRSGEFDGAVLFDDLLAPGGVVAREARASNGRYRTEELAVRGKAYPGEKGFIHGFFSARLGCDSVRGVLDLAAICVRES
jgi:ABC-type transport system substrate-binding protein